MQTCPACQKVNLDEDVKCRSCGKDLPSAASGLGDLPDEHALHKGRGKMLFLLIAVGVGGLALLVYVMLSEDSKAKYKDFSAELAKASREHYQAFWGCALKQNVGNFKNGDEMNSYLLSIAGPGKRPVVHKNVRENCLRLLQQYQDRLGRAQPPAGCEPGLREMRTRLDAVRSSWNDYLTVLSGTETAQDEEMAGRVTESWIGFSRAQSSFVKKLRELRGEKAQGQGQ